MTRQDKIGLQNVSSFWIRSSTSSRMPAIAAIFRNVTCMDGIITHLFRHVAVDIVPEYRKKRMGLVGTVMETSALQWAAGAVYRSCEAIAKETKEFPSSAEEGWMRD